MFKNVPEPLYLASELSVQILEMKLYLLPPGTPARPRPDRPHAYPEEVTGQPPNKEQEEK